jgi:SAM-dependent methyltransferase
VARYDTIGVGYSKQRNADHRIVAALQDLLGLPEGSTIVDLGAGAGNYSNALSALGYKVKAVEPSKAMREQAAPNPNVEWFAGSADSIPLASASVGGLVSTLAVHHFPDLPAAAAEMWRVCGEGRMVLFTIDPRIGEAFWFHDYFPEVHAHLLSVFVPVQQLISTFTLGFGASGTVHKWPLPCDIIDINMHAGWNRPEIYLEYEVRRSMSPIALTDQSAVEVGLDRLSRDLESGLWDEKYGDLREKESFDLGFYFARLSRGA